jgi:hypothetical protein
MKPQERALEKRLAETPEERASHLQLALNEVQQAVANLEHHFFEGDHRS